MSTNTLASIQKSPLVIVGSGNGISVIPQPTVLTRLNYFDGKFLRAEDLRAEQQYIRRLVQLSNQAGGWGVAYGFDLTLAQTGDTFNLAAGLAIDASGNVLLLPMDTTLDIAELIERSRDRVALSKAAITSGSGNFGDCEIAVSAPPGSLTLSSDIYVITVFHAEALCGSEDVFGKLCEEACSTSTDRPYLVEGVLVRAVPLVLRSQLPSSKTIAITGKHFRSQVASAYFEDERLRVSSLISAAGLRTEAWCLGADADATRGVPVGVLARSGEKTLFLDAWIARRERIDTPAKRYWEWRMAMRPLDVYLAQIFQFQCQLHEVLVGGTPTTPPDPCSGASTVIREANEAITDITAFHRLVTSRFAELKIAENEIPSLAGGIARLSNLSGRLLQVNSALSAGASNQILLDGGIVEVPSFGYLIVAPNSSISVNEQVRKLMGAGVDLRFCAVRPDFVPHALEEAQHMERISLLEGLDAPSQKPEVDILVPNGVLIGQQGQTPSSAYEANALFGTSTRTGLGPAGTTIGSSPSGVPAGSAAEAIPLAASTTRLPVALTGAAHVDTPENGSVELFAALSSTIRKFISTTAATSFTFLRTGAAGIANLVSAQPDFAVWLGMSAGKNPLSGDPVGQTTVDGRVIVRNAEATSEVRLIGTLQYRRSVVGAEIVINGAIRGSFQVTPSPIESVLITLRATVSPKTGTQPASLRLEMAKDNSGRSIIFVFQQISAEEIGLDVLQRDEKGTTSSFAKMGLKLNPSVVETSNELHIIAINAISFMAQGMSEPGFIELASEQLFPPLATPNAETIIQATMDWVAFHRRRNKQCSFEIPEIVRPVPRTYRVAHLRIPTTANGPLLQVADVRTALLNNDSAFFERNKLAFQFIDLVEFRAGVPGLATDPRVFIQDWANFPHGPQILHAAIVNNPAAESEGDGLAVSRLDTFVNALRDQGVFSGVNLIAGPELLEKVPDVVNASGVDGGIALVSLEVQTSPFVFAASSASLTIARGTSQPVGTILLTGRGGASGKTVNVNLTVQFSAPVTNSQTDPPRLAIDSPTGTFSGVRVSSSQNSYVFTNVPLLMSDAIDRKWTVSNVFVDSTQVQGGAAPVVTAVLSIQAPAEQPVSLSPTTVQVAIVQTPSQRALRIAIVADVGADGKRILRQGVPLLATTIGDDGTLPATGLPAEIVKELKNAGPFGDFELDIVGSIDPKAGARRAALTKALAPFLTQNVKLEPTRTLPTVDSALASENNINFEDIVFLRKI